LVSADCGPVIHKDCSRNLLVEDPPVEFGRPTAGVVGSRAETENDDAERVEKMPPQKAEQEPPQQRDGETVIKGFDVTGGDPATRGD
jgi:hypothetical protein